MHCSDLSSATILGRLVLRLGCSDLGHVSLGGSLLHFVVGFYSLLEGGLGRVDLGNYCQVWTLETRPVMLGRLVSWCRLPPHLRTSVET